MTPSELFQVIATIISLLGIGYSIGVWHERQRKRRQTLIDALKTVRAGLTSIRLTDVKATSQTVKRGTQITLEYVIESKLEAPLEVWLGANLNRNGGQSLYDTSQDKNITLEPGQCSYTRSLTVVPNASPGKYNLSVEVWLGTRADAKNSVVLAHRRSAMEIVVQ